MLRAAGLQLRHWFQLFQLSQWFQFMVSATFAYGIVILFAQELEFFFERCKIITQSLL